LRVVYFGSVTQVWSINRQLGIFYTFMVKRKRFLSFEIQAVLSLLHILSKLSWEWKLFLSWNTVCFITLWKNIIIGATKMTSCHVIRVSVHKNGCAKLSRTLRHYPFFKDAILVSGSIPHIINLHDSLWENYNVKGCRLSILVDTHANNVTPSHFCRSDCDDLFFKEFWNNFISWKR